MSKIIKVEALIASPPTSKCQETINVLEELVRCHPDECRLTVFTRGVDFIPDEASAGMKCLIQKSSPVPTVVVNGMFFSSRSVPNMEELEARVQQVLSSNEAEHKTDS
jgi:hypothetical protein